MKPRDAQGFAQDLTQHLLQDLKILATRSHSCRGYYHYHYYRQGAELD